MKYLQFAFFTFCLAVLCDADMEVILKCMEKHGVKMDELKNLKRDNASENQKCMAGCTALKYDFPEDIEPTLDIFSDDMDDAEIEKMRECLGGIKSTEDCKLGQDLIDCEKKVKGKA